MIIRTIYCEKTGCDNKFTEQFENQGFPGWGHLAGIDLKAADGKSITPTICPECLKKQMQWLKETE